jgi:serine/threonine-protein kinase
VAGADDLSRYRYISTLGSGGMARVDLAEDTLLGRRVALKRMNDAADAQALSRLRREAVTGASLSHPSLVSIYDVLNTENGHLVIVMEYVPGETLRARINRGGKLPAEDALRILEGVGAGLDAIHARGIVHRDVKPSNILLGADGVVKLADLGIASVPDGSRITTSGSIIGSLSYMAPEQLADTRASAAIDIYALAAVAFEMLAGRKARREPNAVALAHALATQPPPDLRAAWPEAPVAAAELLSRGMARDPKARPRSASELVARLKAALAPEPTAPMAAPEAAPLPVTAVLADRRAARGATGARRAGRARPARAAPAAAAVRPSRSVATARRASGPQRPAASDRRSSGPDARAPLPVEPVGAGSHRRSRAAALAAALLGLVAAAAVLAVVLNSGGGQHQPIASKGVTTHRAGGAATHKQASLPARSASRTHTAAPASSTPAASSPSTASQSSAASSRSAATSATGSSAGGASTPVSAVESFYDLAASHRYSVAWALTDSTLRAQLEGYDRFVTGQSGDRSITFNGARTVSQSAGGATVAIDTTSVRDDGTHHCTGTVDLVSSGSARWLLHQVHINCSA